MHQIGMHSMCSNNQQSLICVDICNSTVASVKYLKIGLRDVSHCTRRQSRIFDGPLATISVTGVFLNMFIQIYVIVGILIMHDFVTLFEGDRGGGGVGRVGGGGGGGGGGGDGGMDLATLKGSMSFFSHKQRNTTKQLNKTLCPVIPSFS